MGNGLRVWVGPSQHLYIPRSCSQQKIVADLCARKDLFVLIDLEMAKGCNSWGLWTGLGGLVLFWRGGSQRFVRGRKTVRDSTFFESHVELTRCRVAREEGFSREGD